MKRGTLEYRSAVEEAADFLNKNLGADQQRRFELSMERVGAVASDKIIQLVEAGLWFGSNNAENGDQRPFAHGFQIVPIEKLPPAEKELAKNTLKRWKYSEGGVAYKDERIAKALVVQKLENDEQITGMLRDWLIEFLQRPGPISRPKGRPDTTFTNNIIVLCIKHLQKKYDLNPTRNDEAKHSISCCDIVADAMIKIGRSPRGYDQIKKIWRTLRVR